MFFQFNEDIRWAINRKLKSGERYEETGWWINRESVWPNSPEGESTPLSWSICYWGDVLWHPSWLRHPPAGGSITALWCIHLEFSHREENENKTDTSRRWQEITQINVIFINGKMFLKFWTGKCVFNSMLSKVRWAAKTERNNSKNREKEKSCFVPVAPLIWGELGNASRIKCYFHSFSLLPSLYKIKLNRGGGVGWGKEEDGKRE